MSLSLTRRQVMAGVAAAALFAPSFSFAAEEADAIYSGGPIITLDDANPRAEAVAVKNGLILAAGSAEEVMKLKGANTKLIDLGGRTMLPGFVDSHGHMAMGGLQALAANMLPPPDGPNSSIAMIQESLRQWVAKNEALISQANLILGFGYDNSQLAELRHPTRDELDQVSTAVPVVIVHQSGHLAVLNSRALELAGYTAETPDPQGGVIQRRPGSQEPNGVLEENAMNNALPALLRKVGPAGVKALAVAGSELWASYGYTTAQEARAAPGLVKAMMAVASEGKFKVDVVAYPDVLIDRDFIKANVSRDYKGRFRVAGAKLSIDGSPQGFTAWRDRPYYAPVGNYPPGYSGYPAAAPEQVNDAVDWAYANDLQIITHAAGERASDQLITAVSAAQDRHGRKPLRPTLIHGHFEREDQVDSYVRLGVIPSLFPMHTFYWGDWHRDHTVGPVLGDNITPTGWYLKRGSIFTSHHDAPVAFPDSMRVLDATVTRRTRSGDILGPTQRVPVEAALKALTLWAAYQIFEEDRKGSIEAGKLADFVILSADPTAVDPETLDQLVVTETIKEGTTIYTSPPGRLKKTERDSGRDNPFQKFLIELAVERDFRNLPERRQTPLNRKILASAPHNRGCVSAVMFDMLNLMLGEA
jgi:hypothetical protein